MPVISRFHGMVVKMYQFGKEHNPPHIHVICGDCMGAIDIQTQQMTEGDLPPKILRLAQKWTRIHQSDLLRMWNEQTFWKLPPL